VAVIENDCGVIQSLTLQSGMLPLDHFGLQVIGVVRVKIGAGVKDS